MGIPRQTEKGFQATVIAFARLHGWTVYHTFDSRRSAAGYPDLTLVKGGRLLFVELKSEAGKTTAAQRAWLCLLGAVPGVEVYEWRPSSWAEIERVLGGK